MIQLLIISAWNANGLSHHIDELKIFIQTFEIDILLVSETHFTNRSYIKISQYKIYHINHPDKTVCATHRDTVIIIRKKLNTAKEQNTACRNAARISTVELTGENTITAGYCPRRYKNKFDD